MSKKDVIALVRKSFDDAIATVSKLTPTLISKTYNTGAGPYRGISLRIHRATVHYCFGP
jgi:hypothetical protein